jgi:hypothetical protein
MSFRDCIISAEAEGTITPEQAREARDLFENLEQEYQGQMSRTAASSQAAQDSFSALERTVAERKRRKLLQIQNWREIKVNLDQYRDIRGNVNYGKAAEALFDTDGLSRYSSVVQREAAVERAATRKLYDVLATFRRNLIGQTRNKAQLKNMVREVFGEDTGDASAREMAQAWKEASDYLRKRFNAAGGQILSRLNWGMPQMHSVVRVRSATFDQWREFILPRLDPEKMIDEQTGLRMSPERLEFALRDVYETIRTDGFNKMNPGATGQGRSIATRRTDHRFLVFKDADSWLQYQQKFGNDNPFDTMFGHIKSMSKDIALMEILGPNPRATVNFLKQTAQKQAAIAGDEAMENAARKSAAKLDTLYMAVTGANNSPIDSRVMSTFAGLRQVLQSAQLGATAITAITDVNFQRMARGFVGLPQATTITDYLKLLMPLGAEERGKTAIRLGLIAEGWSSLASAQMRYVGDISGPEVTRRIADFVMRASFLSPFTQAGRWAFGMEFLGTLADNTAKTFDELDTPLRTTLERYNIGSDKWDIMRSTELYDHEGATFLRAEDIEARTDIDPTLARDLATRMMEMIETETNFAVPSTSTRGRVALTGETRPGTISGELSRSFAMYKNFGVTLVNTHLMRGVTQEGAKAKGKYLADLIISTTVMGALAIQLKEMGKGRDPRPMTDNAFWIAAFLQGGGIGIFGDFISSSENRFGGGLAETVAGPVVGFVDDVGQLTIGNLIQAAKGEDTNIARETIKFVSRYTPGSSLWYARLALERMVTDQLLLYADPKARSNMRRLESRYRREYGQRYWWRPGKTEPSRAPDIENILAQTR